MVVHFIIYFVLAAIAISLGLALFSLLQSKSKQVDPAKMVKALRIRIGLSIFLFMFLIFCFFMGWIKPHGISPIIDKADANKGTAVETKANRQK